LVFPRDHGAHPGYRIEWWYVTANLEDAQHRPFGVQWTLFRYQTRPDSASDEENAWQSRQLFMAHFAVTTPTGHHAFQRYARGGLHGDIAQAGASAEPFAAWLDDWTLASAGDEWLPLALSARAGPVAVALDLTAKGPTVLNGESGFSQKHPSGGGSYYYSQPFLGVTGQLSIDGETYLVTGDAWLDREWSSQFLQADQAGWDWLAVHLESGEKLMLFRLRGREDSNTSGDYVYGSLIRADGSQHVLDQSAIEMNALAFDTIAGRRLPLHWRIELPTLERVLDVTALHPEQWMDLDYPYWEGVVRVEGASPGTRGRGYLELTGY
ncbi:MAG: lipocalin-like domain-containing protein, partial [Xanthomonadales bacterium]|nr:lipocalin-like domain-containing protein [Xanthomonadales bacterium]